MSDDSQPVPSTALQAPSPSSTTTSLTHEQEQVESKGLNEIRAFLSKLLTYVEQIMILGFNSQKYDIPLIRPYLSSAIIKHDGTPKEIIKKLSGYMAVAQIGLKNPVSGGRSYYDLYKRKNPVSGGRSTI